ncbi:50S ribosomal protein L29 [Paramuribaculum intestinale]|uniref:50S ribosomal protein L29 n=1 Tax=Paramuribaculum intestinale TaxID=2094151 RepID=UPI0027333288|nr:50S ribosomal protein L29 [Paramuribaculum intestinale]MCX4358852.1 50S ribosomal protein L29 [Rikenellaceae bacterium]
MKTAEIRELSVQDLAERIEAQKAALNQMKINHSVSPIENSTTINKTRKDIARMLTILRQKQN